MDLPRTHDVLPRIVWRERSPSTNAELRDLVAREDVPHGTLLVTTEQTAGRGRLDRGWVTPPGTAIAASLLIRGGELFGDDVTRGGIGGSGAAGAGVGAGVGAGIGGVNGTDGAGAADSSRAGAVGAPEPVGGSVDSRVTGSGGAMSASSRGRKGPTTRSAQEPNAEPLSPSWLPLLAGSAITTALQPFFRGATGDASMRVGVKWPNDVHVRDEDDAMAGRPGKKLCGILCEMLPASASASASASRAGAASRRAGHPATSNGAPAWPDVIVGTGINLLIPEWELPTDRATSLLAAGADVRDADGNEPMSLVSSAGASLIDRVLSTYVAELLRLARSAVTDPAAARVRVARHSLTLGTEVRVHLPGDEIVDGRARALAADGSLIVDLPTGGVLTVSAGDVEHLR